MEELAQGTQFIRAVELAQLLGLTTVIPQDQISELEPHRL